MDGDSYQHSQSILNDRWIGGLQHQDSKAGEGNKTTKHNEEKLHNYVPPYMCLVSLRPMQHQTEVIHKNRHLQHQKKTPWFPADPRRRSSAFVAERLRGNTANTSTLFHPTNVLISRRFVGIRISKSQWRLNLHGGQRTISYQTATKPRSVPGSVYWQQCHTVCTLMRAIRAVDDHNPHLHAPYLLQVCLFTNTATAGSAATFAMIPSLGAYSDSSFTMLAKAVMHLQLCSVGPRPVKAFSVKHVRYTSQYLDNNNSRGVKRGASEAYGNKTSHSDVSSHMRSFD